MVKRWRKGARVVAVAVATMAAGPIGAESCAACHVKGMPGLGQLQGKPGEDILRVLEAYRSGALPSTMMGRIVRGFTPDEVRSLAIWFSRQ